MLSQHLIKCDTKHDNSVDLNHDSLVLRKQYLLPTSKYKFWNDIDNIDYNLNMEINC